MEISVLQFSLIIVITSTSCVVACAAALWRQAGRSTPPAKPPRTPPVTPPSQNPSDLDLAKLAVDQAELFSTLGKLTTTVKRLSSRAGMQDVRERRAGVDQAPPLGTSKAELRRHYGVQGLTGRDFAQHQLDLERDKQQDH